MYTTEENSEKRRKLKAIKTPILQREIPKNITIYLSIKSVRIENVFFILLKKNIIIFLTPIET